MRQGRQIAGCLPILVAVVIWASCVTSATGQCQYTVDLITAPPCPPIMDPRGVSPTGINKHGHVCGWYNQCEGSGEEAFVWYGPGQFFTLPRPPGYSVGAGL